MKRKSFITLGLVNILILSVTGCGNTVTAEHGNATLTTISSWGNYQINFDGLDIDAANIQGAILETNDGALYGLQHEDNLWIKASELSFPVKPFTEPHGNEVAYQRFTDIPGKTITKVTYLIANGDDIVIPTNLFCNHQLSDEYGTTGDDTVIYSKEGTSVGISLTVPEDSNYYLSSIKKGKSSLDISAVTYEDNTIILPAVYVNGEKLSGKSLSSTLFTEEGLLNLEATTKKDDLDVEVFPVGSAYEVTLEATGFPSITFEVIR